MSRRRSVAGGAPVQLALVRESPQLQLPMGAARIITEHQAPRVLAHAVDSGELVAGPGARFVCRRCGWESGWVRATSTDIRRGVPCATCSPGAR